MLSVINPERKVKNHTQSRNKNNQKQIRQRFTDRTSIPNNPKANNYQQKYVQYLNHNQKFHLLRYFKTLIFKDKPQNYKIKMKKKMIIQNKSKNYFIPQHINNKHIK